MLPSRIYITLICLITFLTFVKGQDLSNLPKLLPSYSEDFSNYNTFPSTCIVDVFLDKNGKLWLKTCGAARATNALHLFQFDGYSFKLVRGELAQLSKGAQIVGLYQDRELVGYERRSDSSQLFFFDLESDQLRFQDFTAEGRIEEMTITEDNRIFLMFEKEGQWVFYEWINGRLEVQCRVEATIQRQDRGHIYYIGALHHDEEVCWLLPLDQPYILLVNKKTASTRKIYPADFEGADSQSNETTEIKAVQADEFYLSRALREQDDRYLFKLDSASNRFVKVEGIPQGWNSNRIFKDQMGNLIFLFKDTKGKYQAILQDTTGNWYDYSTFFESLNGIRILQARSPDFSKQIIICSDKGILLHTIKASESIRHLLAPYSIRAMSELPGQQFLVSTQSNGCYLIDGSGGTTTPFTATDCGFEQSEMHTKFIRDHAGNLWSHLYDDLVKFNPITNSCERYHCESSYIHIFAFIGENRIAIVDNRFNLFIYNLNTRTTEPFLENGQQKQFSGFVHDMHFSQDGWLWVASSTGLWKISPETGETEVFGYEAPFPDFRFLCIHEDEKGRLWLGTPLDGLFIYDPDTGELKILNNEQGLANNTVVSILPDEEGIRWVGTYNGISLVSAEGQLISNIYQQDGLVDRENNRYAYLKASNGQLLIGTVKGLNIIDPRKIKERLNQRGDLKIYLTTLEYPDKKIGENKLQQYGLNIPQNIVLPAASRFLNLSFALSNYFKPEENQYAYMLEGLDDDWTFIGNQHTLSLNNLPSGKYRLLIKGSDAVGNWTPEPLALSIHAKAFFYNQAWFYLLCLAALGSIALLWIQRLRMEVKRATYKIWQDKEVMEQQAGQLLELDKAKSRFFTNISHEFRTPLTIITGMADQIEKSPQKWVARGTQMIRRNSKNLLYLINQILDLSKLESGTMSVHLIQGDIIFYLRYLMESFYSLAESKKVRLHFLNELDELMMDYDKEKIMQIISNLVSNAIKFTPEGGDVYVRIEVEPGYGKQEDYLRIRVIDTGIGIPEEKIPYIFNRFYQVEADSHWEYTGKSEGTGIGLSLTKEFVRLMEGKIEVKSELHKGTSFHVLLPIRREALLVDAHHEFTEQPTMDTADATDAEEAVNLYRAIDISHTNLQPSTIHPDADDTESSLHSNNQRSTLLIIEDNREVALYLESLLENDYLLSLAADGQEGIDKAIEHPPDLIISDVMMPIKDGFEVCATLKQDERTSHIPIVLLTAKADVDSRIAGLKHGADAYLSKPFNQQELFIRLEQLHRLRLQLQARYRSLEPLPAGDPTQPKDFAHPEDAFIAKLRKIIEENLDNIDFGIPGLCKAIGMSRSQLHLKITALTQRSTSHFIRSIRLYKAKELLQHSDLNVTEVAYEVGFQDPTYFSRTFTKEFGVSPVHFLKTDI